MPKTTTPRRTTRHETRRPEKPETPPEGATATSPKDKRVLREKRTASIYGRPAAPPDLPTRDKPKTDTVQQIINSTIAATVSSNILPYTYFNANRVAHREFNRKFLQNSFGLVCHICDRLWFKNDLTKLPSHFKRLIGIEFPTADPDRMVVCKYCTNALSRNHIPAFARVNGFQYPNRPEYLPRLDPISERLISPRIPLRKIQRLRYASHFENLIQIINIPVSENNMVHHLPRRFDDDYCTYVDVERKEIRRSSDFIESVDKQDIMGWLQYLETTPLYKTNDITIDLSFCNERKSQREDREVEVIEHLPNRDGLIAQQHTLIWNVERYLKRDDSEGESHKRLFDGHAEELSFPCIYLGQPRVFKQGLKVTPSMIVSSELTRSDRRGVTPDHLLYMAMKIMRLNVHETLNSTCVNLEEESNMIRKEILSEESFSDALGSNLAFLRCVPNSIWYWKERKRDLFAMMRTLGRPTISLTVSANEIGWIPLLQLLYKLKNKGQEISEESASKLSYVEKCALVNDDVVTCLIYFNKMVNVLISLFRSEDGNPFRQYRVVHHFQRIEFQYHRSPCVHILMWVENAPKDPLGADKEDAITLIDQLISISTKEASGHIELQAHKHTSACYKKVAGKKQICRFEAPFMPCRSTTILEPMASADPEFAKNARHYQEIRENLENHDYPDIDAFYDDNGIVSDEQYMNILRAGITRPRVFLQREPSEKWHEAFNPFILNVLQGHINIQFILDEDSCADFIGDFIHKTDRGIGELQRKIVAIIDEHPEFKLSEIIRRLSVDVLNAVEITSQEAAWYLLREPMSKSSSVVVPIQTVLPSARQAIRKNYDEFGELALAEDTVDSWKESWFAMYQMRPKELENVTLAQFVAYYTRNFNNTAYVMRKTPRIIRYQNYSMETHPNDYKREMVTLHIPFRNEESEIIAGMKFLQLYEANEELILTHQKEFEVDVNVQTTMNACCPLCREEDALEDENEVNYLVAKQTETDPFQDLGNHINPETNDQLEFMDENEPSDALESHENLLDDASSHEPVFIVPEETDVHPMHGLFTLLTGNDSPFQMFLSGPAKCRKTFITRLLMEIYNSRAQAGSSCNVCINLTSANKAGVLVNRSITYTALTTSRSKMLTLAVKSSRHYGQLFEYAQVLIIDEIDKIDGNILSRIDASLRQLTGNSSLHFGGVDIILTGEFYQLSQAEAGVIKLQWNDLKFLDTSKLMRQSNRMFRLVLTKIGRNIHLEESELQLLESRFFSRKEANRLLPHGVRLMLTNDAVDEYNKVILRPSKYKVVSIAKDTYTYSDGTEEERTIHSLRDRPIDQTAGLPYEIIFVMNKSYMLTSSVDELAGLCPGSLGKLVFIEYDDDGQAKRVWLEFYNMSKVDVKMTRNVNLYMQANNISELAIPVKRQTSRIPLNDDETVVATRDQFPLIPACAITINESQGSHLNEMVYEYSRTHSQQILHMALLQVSTISKLYIVSPNNDPTFYHGRRKPSSETSSPKDKPMVLDKSIIDFITSRSGLAVLSFSCQSQTPEDSSAEVGLKSEILLLSEMSAENEETLVMPDFNCMARFKRFGGVNGPSSVYRSDDDRTNVVTAHMDVHLRRSTCLIVNSTKVGEICAARCTLEDNQTVLTVIMYVSVNQEVSHIITFINEVLLEYTTQGAALLGNDLDKIPVILSGDFNINFDSPEAQKLIEFLDTDFNLKLNRDPAMASAKSGATIDAVFFRYLEKLRSTSYVSYFRYDRPAVMYENCGDTDTVV
ncbi:uncharacterized protein LOC107037018 [Diachasma alloeum]|uniref:uncharacterized protein LOC107037018 n=1 Tax=Diachasma alloeum TaxID=454923 RepID=UPI0007381187|nr:uncharacterized protein LOC107037018 [Diachasma alloeum]